jgi:hypothetical protein
MRLVRIKKSKWPASAFGIWQQCMVLPIFENLCWQLETNVITNFNFWDFELFFRAFLVFLQIHSSVFILFCKKHFFSELWTIQILFLQLQILHMNLSTSVLLASYGGNFKQNLTKSSQMWLKPNLKIWRR